ncbi:MAG TPA: hypothetical protein VLZ75_06360 [Chitinophagales bacterium]|nr:hypothetical protein [Chitinophagales bacterium]
MRSYSFILIGILFCNQLFAQDEILSFSSTPDIEIQEELPNHYTHRSIAWNVQNFKYYTTAVDSGKTFIETFDALGQSKGNQEFDFISKGIWYNTTLDFLEIYNSSDNSCYSFFIDDEGEFENNDTSLELEALEEKGTSVFPAYNSNKDLLVYFEPIAGIVVEIEPISGDILNYISLNLPVSKKSLAIHQLLFTGRDEAPYALVNMSSKLVYFFDTDGNVAYTLSWPQLESTPTHFGFTNGAFWMYSAIDSSWKGYAIQ